MATITQRNGKYRAQVRLRGVSKSATFERHADAKAWAARMETLILDGVQGNADRNTYFADILQRYLSSVTPTRRGAKFEGLRIRAFLRDPLAEIRLDDLRPQHFADWRDRRLQQVSAGSVLREIGILSAICTHAVKEWGLLRENPLSKISKPKEPKARTRRPSESEIDALCTALLYSSDAKPELVYQRAAAAFLFAVETAMRAGEICGLKWRDIDFKRRLAHLPMTKNGHSRDVPFVAPRLVYLGAIARHRRHPRLRAGYGNAGCRVPPRPRQLRHCGFALSRQPPRSLDADGKKSPRGNAGKNQRPQGFADFAQCLLQP
ncbi:tyrosine-type recombinase/integrase [Kingella potus]|nr:tyrosine-type recombinase/integrase [Kingella potus]